MHINFISTIYRQIVKYWLKLTCTSDHRYIAIAFRESASEWSLFVKRLVYENVHLLLRTSYVLPSLFTVITGLCARYISLFTQF